MYTTGSHCTLSRQNALFADLKEQSVRSSAINCRNKSLFSLKFEANCGNKTFFYLVVNYLDDDLSGNSVVKTVVHKCLSRLKFLYRQASVLKQN